MRKAALVLENTSQPIQISSYDSKMTITFTDGATYLKEIVDATEGNIDSSIFVEYNTLYDLLRTLPHDAAVSITESDYIELRYTDGEKCLPKLLHSQHIQIPEVEGVFVEHDFGMLIDKLKFVRHTVANDGLRNHFKGVSMSIEGQNQSFWSSDGYRFSITETDTSDIVHSKKTCTKCILPKRLVDMLCNVYSQVQGKINLTISDTHIMLSFDDTTIVTPLINAIPFDYTSIMQFKGTTPILSIRGDPNYLIQALERSMIGVDEQKLIKFDFREEDAALVTNNIVTNMSGREKLDRDILDIEGSGYFHANGNNIIGFLKQFITTKNKEDITRVNILYYEEKNILVVTDEKYDFSSNYRIYLTRGKVF